MLLGGGYSEVTIKHYDTLLKRLDKLEIDYKKIKTAQELKEKVLEHSKVGDTSIRVYLQAILFSKTNTNKKFMESARKFITETSKNERIERGENNLVRNQKDNYVDWDIILDVYKDAEKKKNLSDFDTLNYVILSLYVLFPPRRLTDYSLMKVNTDNKIKVNKGLTKQYDKFNYYSPKKHLFVFNNYKTNKKVIRVEDEDNKPMYKQQIFKVPPNLAKVLNSFIKEYDIDNGDLLLDMTTDSLGDRITKIFSDAISKNVSLNILRHSYISYILSDRKKFNSNLLYEISQQMAHSINMQNQYYKNNED